jgi:hypothetical protein
MLSPGIRLGWGPGRPRSHPVAAFRDQRVTTGSQRLSREQPMTSAEAALRFYQKAQAALRGSL